MSGLDSATGKLAVGVGVGVVTLIAVKLWLDSKKKAGPPATLVDSSAKYSLPLVEKVSISHDTRLYRFGLPSPRHCLGLPTGQHVFLSAKVDGKLVVRPYTPTSCDEDLGKMDLVVKVYPAGVHPKFPEGGKLTQHLDKLQLGDTIDVRGPSGRLVYEGLGAFRIRDEKDRVGPGKQVRAKQVNMIAGGTGITPMLQLARAVFRDPADTTQLALLFANQTEEDILLREELEQLASEHPDQFKLWYTVDRPTEGWTYSSGFINAEMIQQAFFPPSPDGLVLLCGPPPMINFACNPNLDKLGYTQSNRFAY